jgi:hypothetical protein
MQNPIAGGKGRYVGQCSSQLKNSQSLTKKQIKCCNHQRYRGKRDPGVNRVDADRAGSDVYCVVGARAQSRVTRADVPCVAAPEVLLIQVCKWLAELQIADERKSQSECELGVKGDNFWMNL